MPLVQTWWIYIPHAFNRQVHVEHRQQIHSRNLDQKKYINAPFEEPLCLQLPLFSALHLPLRGLELAPTAALASGRPTILQRRHLAAAQSSSSTVLQRRRHPPAPPSSCTGILRRRHPPAPSSSNTIFLRRCQPLTLPSLGAAILRRCHPPASPSLRPSSHRALGPELPISTAGYCVQAPICATGTTSGSTSLNKKNYVLLELLIYTTVDYPNGKIFLFSLTFAMNFSISFTL